MIIVNVKIWIKQMREGKGDLYFHIYVFAVVRAQHRKKGGSILRSFTAMAEKSSTFSGN